MLHIMKALNAIDSRPCVRIAHGQARARVGEGGRQGSGVASLRLRGLPLLLYLCGRRELRDHVEARPDLMIRVMRVYEDRLDDEDE